MMDRTTRAEIEFGMFDVTAKDDSTISVSQKQEWNHPESQLKEDEKELTGYGTLEKNQFILNKKLSAIPDDTQSHFFGWWSKSQSDQSCNFERPLVLTAAFKNNHSSLGITLRCEQTTNDYCKHINIKWYDSAGVLMANQEFYPNSAYYFADKKVENYYKVVVTFYSTNKPFRYLKLAEIMYGTLRILGGSDLIWANILEEVNPMATQLSVNTLSLEFHSSSGEFAILNMKGVWSLFQWRQWLRAWVYVNNQKFPMGTFYLDKPEANTENQTTLDCIDLIGVIDSTKFKGGMYEQATAEALIAQIMVSAEEPYGYSLDASLKGKVLSGWLPICTHREALQQVAFAVGAIVDCSRSDKIKFYPMPAVTSLHIGRNRKIIGHSLKRDAMYTGVEITSHNYVAEQAEDKEQELQNEEMQIGEHEIIFGSPMHSISATGARLLESNANYAKIKVDVVGMVVLKGKAYQDNTAMHGAYIPLLPANAKPNVLTIEDATLVSSAIAPAVAQRTYEYYQNVYKDDGEIILSGEQVGQKVAMDSMNNRKIEGIVESLDIDLTGGFLAKAKITGKAVD